MFDSHSESQSDAPSVKSSSGLDCASSSEGPFDLAAHEAEKAKAAETNKLLSLMDKKLSKFMHDLAPSVESAKKLKKAEKSAKKAEQLSAKSGKASRSGNPANKPQQTKPGVSLAKPVQKSAGMKRSS